MHATCASPPSPLQQHPRWMGGGSSPPSRHGAPTVRGVVVVVGGISGASGSRLQPGVVAVADPLTLAWVQIGHRGRKTGAGTGGGGGRVKKKGQ